jgi:transcriptional regulator with XRE-family HTH domain
MAGKQTRGPYGPNRVRAIRKARGLSLEAVAGEIGISHSILSRVERGKNGLSQPLIDELAMILRVRRGQLFDGPVPTRSDDE